MHKNGYEQTAFFVIMRARLYWVKTFFRQNFYKPHLLSLNKGELSRDLSRTINGGYSIYV